EAGRGEEARLHLSRAHLRDDVRLAAEEPAGVHDQLDAAVGRVAPLLPHREEDLVRRGALRRERREPDRLAVSGGEGERGEDEGEDRYHGGGVLRGRTRAVTLR